VLCEISPLFGLLVSLRCCAHRHTVYIKIRCTSLTLISAGIPSHFAPPPPPHTGISYSTLYTEAKISKQSWSSQIRPDLGTRPLEQPDPHPGTRPLDLGRRIWATGTGPSGPEKDVHKKCYIYFAPNLIIKLKIGTESPFPNLGACCHKNCGGLWSRGHFVLGTLRYKNLGDRSLWGRIVRGRIVRVPSQAMEYQC
jgi:hypothetical protein